MKDAYEDEPHADAQVAMLIANQAADNDNQVSVEQVRQQLAEEYPLAAVPFDDYVEKSEVLEEAAAPVTVTPARIRRMESRSIRTANGVSDGAGISKFPDRFFGRSADPGSGCDRVCGSFYGSSQDFAKEKRQKKGETEIRF